MPVHSTLSTFDPMPTLALILTPQSGPARLDAVLGNPFLHSIFQGALNSHVLDYRISLTDIMAHLNNNTCTTYTLDSDIAALFLAFSRSSFRLLPARATISILTLTSYHFLLIFPKTLSLPLVCLNRSLLGAPFLLVSIHLPWNFTASLTSLRCLGSYKTSLIFSLGGLQRQLRSVFHRDRILSGILAAILD